MPLIDAGFQDDEGGPSPDKLERYGPTLFVDVGFDPGYRPEAGGMPDLQRSNVPALVDTGASESCIDDALARELDLVEVDRQEISGVSGVFTASRYLAHIYSPQLALPQWGLFSGVDLIGGGQAHQLLIGRSFMRNLIMIYDGVRGQVTLAR